MQRKIFIGIDLPAQIKKRLMQKVKKWEDLPVRWSEAENLHVTLVFLGYVDNDLLPEVCTRAREAIEKHEMFDIELNEIRLSENEKVIWATGGADERLRKVQEDISKSLGLFGTEKKNFKPHITLGRVRKKKWNEMENHPEIKQDYKFAVPVESIEVIESKVENGKRKFTPIESCSLSFS